jgi:hypothetical protein
VRFSAITFFATAFLAASALPMRAVEFSAIGISLPFFNATGKMTHKMIAKDGAKAGNLQMFREVEIHYFSPDDPTIIVQKLEAEEATWDARKETLVGRGPVVVATEENRVTGEGFDFALATSLLKIHRNFTMSNREVVTTSDRAIVELVVDRSGDQLKIRDVKRAEAIGNLQIVVQPTAMQKYDFEKALSDFAIYDGATQTITLPNPIRLTKKDQPAGQMNKATIRLKDTAVSPAKSSPVSPGVGTGPHLPKRH